MIWSRRSSTADVELTAHRLGGARHGDLGEHLRGAQQALGT